MKHFSDVLLKSIKPSASFRSFSSVETLSRIFRGPKTDFLNLIPKESFEKLFEEIPPAPEGKGYFIRVMSWGELENASKELDQIKIKNTRYYKSGQTANVDTLKLPIGESFQGSKSISLLFTLDLNNVRVASESSIGNYADPITLLELTRLSSKELIKDKLTKIDCAASNDCAVNISSKSYREDSKLLIPQQIRLPKAQFAQNILSALRQKAEIVGEFPVANFLLRYDDKICKIRDGKEREVEQILVERASDRSDEHFECLSSNILTR